MEDRFQHAVNGQSVLQGDLNLLGETGALADDRVFAELLRLLPYNGSSPSRGILPFGHAGSANAATVAPNGATGSVLVNPFRAVIGPCTDVATDAKKNWRDIRSAIGVGSTTLVQTQAFAANSSGNSRWDLIYAAVTIDANAPAVTRKVKDPASKVIASQAVVNVVRTTVSIGVQAGTASAAPAWPSAPSDSGGTYYIPLSYVRIPNGFSASSTVLPTDIATVAPIVRLSRATGAASLRVADQQYALTTAQQQTWGSTGNRPKLWMPPEVNGQETLLVALDFLDASSANWSHQNNGLVDSGDWRGRLCKWMVHVEAVDTGVVWAWNTTDNGEPFGGNSILEHNVDAGMGQSIAKASGPLDANKALIAMARGGALNGLSSGVFVYLYSDLSDGGKLKVRVDGSPQALIFFWLEFSGPYTNK